MAEHHGAPCWYELGTNDLAGAGAFYGTVLDWSVRDSGMPGMSYHLADAPDGGGVAGMMDNTDQPGPPPPNWVIYFAVDGCDTTTDAVTAAGGAVLVPGTDIPGTGRFAICADPQGAIFGVLQPEPMDTEPTSRAFDMTKPGHGGWHELMTPDIEGALAFYGGLFGWTSGATLDMGNDGVYQLVQREGADFAGVMGLGAAPVPAWLPYFGAPAGRSSERITAAGGTIVHGPVEVPGGAHIAIAIDPQGAFFATVGEA